MTRIPAILESSARYVQVLARQLLALAPSLTQFDDAIAQRFAALIPMPPCSRPCPRRRGHGPAPFGRLRHRSHAISPAADLQMSAGIAPITVRSGKQWHVHWRWATSTFLRQTFQEFANQSIRQCPWARAFYHQQRQRGKTHHAAVRSLAFKWIRILWRCWQDHAPYDDARYERALTQHGPHSPPSSTRCSPEPKRPSGVLLTDYLR